MTSYAVPLAEVSPAERHLRIAETFADRVAGTTDWEAPAPVDGWTARDVVRHLIDWFPGFLAGGGLTLPDVADVDADPVGAWTARSGDVQALLEAPDPDTFSHPMVGAMPLPDAVDRFYTADVFMHTWDLARATRQDERLDPAYCTVLLEGMEPMEKMIRASGQYGPRVEVPADAEVQTRLLGFIGRRP